uniref:Piezo-type mechanosensitive ion channel component 1 n=1 Tax=Sphaerodactylus townsendi TaxID=933632 RepID=A0ACB8EAT4_9SAUR
MTKMESMLGVTPCIPGHTGRLLRALLATSILFLVAHLVFQVCLYTVPALDQLLGSNCSKWQNLSVHIGVTRLDLNDVPNSVRLVAPDLGILLVSAICLGICSRLEPSKQPATRSKSSESICLPEQWEKVASLQIVLLLTFGK